MRQRFGEEDGFALLELITAITIAMIVSLPRSRSSSSP
jgi:hypothetical protein